MAKWNLPEGKLYTQAELDAERERWRQNSIETWAAMTAMRDSINEHIPMPSLEADLLQGPEASVFCATVAEAVISVTADLRADLDFANAQLEAWGSTAPPPEPNALRKQLERRAAIRAKKD